MSYNYLQSAELKREDRGKELPSWTDEEARANTDGLVNDDLTVCIAKQERAVVRKVDMRLLPWMMVCYTCLLVDRGNISTGKRIITWSPRLDSPDPNPIGQSQTCLAAVQNFASLFVVRVLLGVMEAGFGPGMMLYLTFWYKKYEVSGRWAAMYGGALIISNFGILLSWAIAHMDGAAGLPGWRWLFIIDFPQTCGFLNDREKSIVIGRLPPTGPTLAAKEMKLAEIIDAFSDWTMYAFAFALMLLITTVSAMASFQPTIINLMGFVSTTAQLLGMGASRVAIRSAFTLAAGNIGAAVGGQVYQSDDAPLYIRGHYINAGLSIATLFVWIFTVFIVTRKGDYSGHKGNLMVIEVGGVQLDDRVLSYSKVMGMDH
ncbi:hypothetical protein HDU93_007630 [Gonapodya sp. JEL0774]|nr:hypothetical protein HDU93_007630 [Gonapodya sp. JEL0774]